MSKDIREDGALGHQLWLEEQDKIATERRMAIEVALLAKDGVGRAFEINRFGYTDFAPEEKE